MYVKLVGFNYVPNQGEIPVYPFCTPRHFTSVKQSAFFSLKRRYFSLWDDEIERKFFVFLNLYRTPCDQCIIEVDGAHYEFWSSFPSVSDDSGIVRT